MSKHGKRAHAMHNASSAQYWMACGLYYQHKRLGEEEGTLVDRETEAMRRGTMQHEVAERAMEWLLDHGAKTEDVAETVRDACDGLDLDLKPEERVNVQVAINGALTLIPDKMDVGLEIPLPLSHEPESTGPADLMGYVEVDGVVDHVLVLDYKFGQSPVSPNSWQLKIYGANALSFLRDQGLTIGPATRVKLAVMQPVLHLDPIVRVYDALDLVKAQAHVEAVVHEQVGGGPTMLPGSLKVCEGGWRCPFADSCYHRPNLVKQMMATLGEAGAGKLRDSVVEEIVRGASGFEKVIKECKEEVKSDEGRFPNWTRVRVPNAEKWSPLLSQEEIVKKLKKAEDLLVLNTPNAVRSANPKLTGKIDALVDERGHHIRLYEGEPKGAPKQEPQRRAQKRPAKTAAKKAAKKGKKK